ncbi:hypothetical protein EUAN_01410 [Andreesenia angusta]|uniref:DUF4349 domain-containing protein n=1 Tax=Andreesenia angusta TaxID=39480 RepID=A0A1S1VAM9_9FIRM|nr:DUF4349 domain-containing protein [Andreesenia angusta]OHW63277.1 hypothetical protein EUAN_01410 [Andreesenia angusta]
MFKKWKSVIAFVLIAILSTALVQCTSKSQEQSDIGPGVTEESVPDYAEDSENSKSGAEGEDSKVVTNVYMAIETLEFDSSVEKLEASVEKQSGYVEYSNIGYNNYIGREVYKSGNFTVRVPSEKEAVFKKEIAKLGNVTSESTSKSDITKTYRDTETKLKVLETKEQRILALMEKATAIEDIIKLEESLNETIYEKEQLKSEISSMDTQVSFSTVEVNLLEVERYSTGDTPDTGFWKKVSEAFKNSFYVFGVVLERLVIIAIYMIPFAILGVAIYIVIRKYILKRRNK